MLPPFLQHVSLSRQETHKQSLTTQQHLYALSCKLATNNNSVLFALF